MDHEAPVLYYEPARRTRTSPFRGLNASSASRRAGARAAPRDLPRARTMDPAARPRRLPHQAEIERRVVSYGLPTVVWPPDWPPNTLAAMRAAVWAETGAAARRSPTRPSGTRSRTAPTSPTSRSSLSRSGRRLAGRRRLGRNRRLEGESGPPRRPHRRRARARRPWRPEPRRRRPPLVRDDQLEADAATLRRRLG